MFRICGSFLDGAWGRRCVGSSSALCCWWDTFLLLFRESLFKELTLKSRKSRCLHLKQKYQYSCFWLGSFVLIPGDCAKGGNPGLAGGTPNWTRGDFFAIIKEHINSGTGWLCVSHLWGRLDGWVGDLSRWVGATTCWVMATLGHAVLTELFLRAQTLFRELGC